MAENAKSPNTSENTTANPTVPATPANPGHDWAVTSTPAANQPRKGPTKAEEAVPVEPVKDADRDEDDDEETKRAKRVAKKEKHQIW